MSGTERVLYIVDLPFMILTYLTILPTRKEHFSKLRCLVWCVTGIAFILFVTTGKPNLKWVYIGVPVGIVLIVLFYLTIPDTKSEQPKQGIQFLVTFLGSMSSCCWMYILLELLIDMLNTIGLVFDLESSFLGFTVIAIGNALPDAMNTIAFSKQGQAIMAISGAYNG